MKKLQNGVKNIGNKIAGGIKTFWNDEAGMGTVEVILIIVEKPNAKHRYVLCGN
ncbi:MAG: hypothetical protein IJJ65_06685 [Butyrivibrio sp.]|nr:hypothetical protein [Butyrivibrio sp.]